MPVVTRARVRVLPRRVEAADERVTSRTAGSGRRSAPTAPCAKAGRGRGRSACRPTPQPRVPRDLAERTTTLSWAARDLRHQMVEAGGDLRRRGGFWGGAQRTAAAMYTPRSPRPSSRWCDVGRLASPARWSAAIRKSPEAPAPVAGEHAAGAVGAVRGRGQAEDQDARGRVAEAGHRPGPVDVVRNAARFLRATSWQYGAGASSGCRR